MYNTSFLFFMNNISLFIFNSCLLGVGLAMDAFSVSLANGLNEPDMKKTKMFLVAGLFAVFQTLMPLLGWFCVHSFVERFKQFERLIPWIAFLLLLFIGGKMLADGIKNRGSNDDDTDLSVGLLGLFVQALATSIDALSVGFTISDYVFSSALYSTMIIGIVTFVLCLIGVSLGKKFGTKFSNFASILGGSILIIIGIEIFISGVF